MTAKKKSGHSTSKSLVCMSSAFSALLDDDNRQLQHKANITMPQDNQTTMPVTLAEVSPTLLKDIETVTMLSEQQIKEFKLSTAISAAADSDIDSDEEYCYGACHCRRVRLRVHHSVSFISRCCHCADCRIVHGAAYIAVSYTNGNHAAVQCIRGANDVQYYRSEHNPKSIRIFCRHCGSRLCNVSPMSIGIFPSTFVARPFHPIWHSHYRERLADVHDNAIKLLDTFAEWNGSGLQLIHH